MKIIHTADWHLGNSLFNIDRSKEFEAFLCWLKGEIVERKADALVVSGDVFDVANPPVNSRKQYNRFLASLLGTSCRNVIIVGGNHDSGALLDSQKEILDALSIHVVGSVSDVSPEEMVFEIKDEKDETIGICAAVPFAREIELRKFTAEKVQKGTLSDAAYKALYEKVLEAAKKRSEGKKVPLIATGHLYASGLEGRFENGEQIEDGEKEVRRDDGRRTIDDVIGNLGSVHVSTFPKEFDYVALGHIHYHTMVAKNPKVRYSGSPFILGFDETEIPHYVLEVDFKEGKEAEVTKIQVPHFFEYKRLKGTSREIKEKLSEYVGAKLEKPLFIEAYYKREEGININDMLAEVIEKLPSNVFVVNRKPQEMAKRDDSRFGDMDAEELKNLLPEDIFKSLILSKSEFDAKGLSEKEIEEKNKELLNKYLPLFMEIAKEVENGVSDENN